MKVTLLPVLQRRKLRHREIICSPSYSQCTSSQNVNQGLSPTFLVLTTELRFSTQSSILCWLPYCHLELFQHCYFPSIWLLQVFSYLKVVLAFPYDMLCPQSWFRLNRSSLCLRNLKIGNRSASSGGSSPKRQIKLLQGYSLGNAAALLFPFSTIELFS